ncbi:MAG: GTPase HflX [Pseudomonadota bacterium]
MTGLKASQFRQLRNLYRRRIEAQALVTPAVATDVARLSFELGREVAIVVSRAGNIEYVVVGENSGLLLPAMDDYRSGGGRLRGLRCVHTQLNEGGLSQDDLTDLALLRLDAMAVIEVRPDGSAGAVHCAHLLPGDDGRASWQRCEPRPAHDPQLDFGQLVRSLEDEFARQARQRAVSDREKAVLVSVSGGSRIEAEDQMEELAQLADSAGLEVVGRLMQRARPEARFLIGRGKLAELNVQAMQGGADLIIFDQELNPSQVRHIAEVLDLRIIDRSQLILDIFAQRALSREGKLQVEMAQLKYVLPRLVGQGTAMSRLTGGIGGRGPGEQKLEIDRRRVRERIHRLRADLDRVKDQRERRRDRRREGGLPIVSLVGYTNAGKSTLLNTLTNSSVHAEDRLFATLDPTSRRLRFPPGHEAIVTDTVGFIRDLPKDLLEAFGATLEELRDAVLLLHVIDASSPNFERQIGSVESILEDLDLTRIPLLRVLNKADRCDPDFLARQCRHYQAVAVSALRPQTMPGLMVAIEGMLGRGLVAGEGPPVHAILPESTTVH